MAVSLKNIFFFFQITIKKHLEVNQTCLLRKHSLSPPLFNDGFGFVLALLNRTIT